MLKLVQGGHKLAKVHIFEEDLGRDNYSIPCPGSAITWASGAPKIWNSAEPHKEITCQHCLKILGRTKPHLFPHIQEEGGLTHFAFKRNS